MRQALARHLGEGDRLSALDTATDTLRKRSDEASWNAFNKHLETLKAKTYGSYPVAAMNFMRDRQEQLRQEQETKAEDAG